VIRRGFWLTAGAVTGIYGYRRVCAVGRQVSGILTSKDQLSQSGQVNRGIQRGQIGRGARLTGRGAVGLARETFRFTRDVREGMELYMARHSAPGGPTLRTSQADAIRQNDQNDDDEKEGR
jgi:hypothetical protein